MDAMVLRGPAPASQSPLRVENLPMPIAGPGQVRLRVLACGVCHTDLHMVEGDLELPQLPTVPGHQVVGIVDALGPGVVSPREGERVGVPWLHETCGGCPQCSAGRENLCEAARFTGLHVNGGYAEFMVAPASFVYPVPDGITALQAAPLLCAGIIGYRALHISGIRPGQRLGLWGFGASAHVTIQIARHWGCEIFVISRSEEHREHARALGAVWAGDAGERPPRPLDAGINFTPAGPTVPEGLRALRPGGTLALAGIHMSDLPAMEYGLLCGERVLRSVANSTREDGHELLALAAEIPIRTDIEVFSLADANIALERMARSEVRGAAVLRVSPEANR